MDGWMCTLVRGYGPSRDGVKHAFAESIRNGEGGMPPQIFFRKEKTLSPYYLPAMVIATSPYPTSVADIIS